jgi:hypothetical protein
MDIRRNNLILLDSVLNTISKKGLPIFTQEGRALIEININRNNDEADVVAFLEDGTCVARVRLTLADPPV